MAINSRKYYVERLHIPSYSLIFAHIVGTFLEPFLSVGSPEPKVSPQKSEAPITVPVIEARSKHEFLTEDVKIIRTQALNVNGGAV